MSPSDTGYHDRQPSSLSQNSGSQEFDWAETASQRSTQLDDHLSEIISIGSSKSEAPPKFCVALYDYKVGIKIENRALLGIKNKQALCMMKAKFSPEN